MYRIKLIIDHPLFSSYLEKNVKSESGRPFCKHNMEHFLDVARIAYIINQEKSLDFDKEIIYATALLHDITKWKQYLDNEAHNVSAIRPAELILKQSGFSSEEIKIISQAILNHRTESIDEKSLDFLIYRSDKLSRPCFSCENAKECNWSEKKKNLIIVY